MRIASALVASLLLAGVVLAEGDEGVRARIAELGAEDPAARDAAQAELERLGAEDEGGEVEALLTEAAEGSDPEMASRARTALRAVRYWENIVVVGGTWARALDLEAGTLLWKRDGECEAWVGPRRWGALALIALRTGGIEAVDLRTGESRWRLSGMPRGVLLDQGDWVGAEDGKLLFARGDSGLRWSRDEDLGGAPLTSRDVATLGAGLYVRTANGLVASSAETGEVWWRRSTPLESFLVAPGGLCVAEHVSDGTIVRKLHAESGMELWERTLRGTEWSLVSDGPWVQDELVVLSNGVAGPLVGWSARSGEDRWTLEAGFAGLLIPGLRPRTALLSLHAGWGEGLLRRIGTTDGATLAETAIGTGVVEILELDGLLLLAEWNDEVDLRSEVRLGLSLRALAPGSLATLWTAELKGSELGGAFGQWIRPKAVRLEKLGSRIVVWTEGWAGVSMELVDPANGRVLAREVLAR